MTRSGDPEEGEGEIWGTWEELLLASAVSRHGTHRWDSVAMEVQSRIPPSSAHLFTSLSCRQRFNLLQHRFSTTAAAAAAAEGEPDVGSSPDVPWLEELRKLRVAELRREVERSDLSIRTLQLKVKRLKDERERERSVGEAEHGGGGADPKSGEGRKGSAGSTPEALAGDRISGRSCKESNSTDPKEDGRKPDWDVENAGDTAGDGNRKTDPIAGERSDDRSSAAGDPDPADPRESGESAAESKGDGAEEREGEKESSEVQSSASLMRRRRMGRRRKAPSASSSGAAAAEEPETDVVSRHAGCVPAVGLQPLVSFLHIVRSSKPGSVFARRLESQETAEYKGLIRRHVDLEMVGHRIERSGGAYTNAEFFRDLLLLCNNAIVFYPKASDEAMAAVHLRELISKEMAASKERPVQAPPPPVIPAPLPQPQPQPQSPKPKEDPDLAGSLLEKSTSAAPLMIVCRKRSSISAKKVDPDRKEEKEEKSDPDRKERDAEDPTLKKKSKERSSFPPARGLRTNKTRRLPKNTNPDPSPNLNAQVAGSTAKGDKKSSASAGPTSGSGGGSLGKKRSATSFLNRMKRSSPSNGTLLESLKSSGAGASGGAKATEQKKGGKGDGRKENSKSGGGATSKQAQEPSARTKKSVGRPPKRGAAPPSKRAREEAEGSKPTPPARKRGRR